VVPAALQNRLRADLTAALRQRDTAAVAALRTALAAIANAEAVPADDTPVLGVNGYADVARRNLTIERVVQILQAEAQDRLTAIAEYEQLGQHDQAQRLRNELAVLNRYLPDPVVPD
jgi:uncharacterized protein YqeY